jgi:predicted GTPase
LEAAVQQTQVLEDTTVVLVTLQLFQRFHPLAVAVAEHHVVVTLLQLVDQAVLAAVAVLDQAQLLLADQATHHPFLRLKVIMEVQEKMVAQFLAAVAAELVEQVRQPYGLEHLDKVETV